VPVGHLRLSIEYTAKRDVFPSAFAYAVSILLPVASAWQAKRWLLQKLDVITSNYFQGSTQYSGSVSFSTYKGDLAGFPVDSRALIQEYEGFQQQREFYSPSYAMSEEKQSRLPDLRNLLYWNPEVTTTATGAQTLEFYTGDQTGTYVVVAQGISPSGLAGTTRFTFEVKQAL
jgi:hypothetical protein